MKTVNMEENMRKDFLGELYEERNVEVNYHLSRLRLLLYSIVGLATTVCMLWGTFCLTDTITQKVIFALVACFGVFVTLFAFVYFCFSFNIR